MEMKLIAASLIAAMLSMGAVEAQSVRIGVGVRIGLPSVRIVVPRHSPRVRVRRHVPPVRIVRPAPRGHWVLQQVRYWVPASYAYMRDAHGRRIRYLVRRGYYEFREERVWVSAPRQARRARPHPTQEHRTRVGVLYS